jgi:hypothetical protein
LASGSFGGNFATMTGLIGATFGRERAASARRLLTW